MATSRSKNSSSAATPRTTSYGTAKVTSNVDGHIAELEEMLAAINYTAVRAEVWTEVEYAVFVEFGTYRMAPRAMVRTAIPDIEKKFNEGWMALPTPFTKADVEKLFKDTIDFAKVEITKRTPRKSGTLQDSWEASEVEFS